MCDIDDYIAAATKLMQACRTGERVPEIDRTSGLVYHVVVPGEPPWWDTWVWWVHPLGFGFAFALTLVVVIVGMELWPSAGWGFLAFGASFSGYRVATRFSAPRERNPRR